MLGQPLKERTSDCFVPSTSKKEEQLVVDHFGFQSPRIPHLETLLHWLLGWCRVLRGLVLRELRWDHPRLRWAPYPVVGALIRGHEKAAESRRHVMMEAEITVMCLEAKKHQGLLPGARREAGASLFPRAFRRDQPHQHLNLQLWPPDGETTNSYCFKSSLFLLLFSC